MLLWIQKRVEMSDHKFAIFIALTVAALMLGACVSTEEPVSTEIPKIVITPAETAAIPTETSVPVEAIIQELARQLGVEAASIQVISIDAAEWPDSCLGAARPDEMCLEVITPGYGGIVEVNGVRYEFRSDLSGDQVRIIPTAVDAAQQALALKLGVSSESVQMLSFTQMTWRDSCLGVEITNQACLDVITPGYQIVLQANGEQYIYHSDERGNKLVLAESPLADSGDALITWSESNELGCQQALIKIDEISFGACEAAMTVVPFSRDAESNDLTYFSQKYAPFEAQTAAGEISFSGVGSEIATPAEQRMIAAWARLTKEVAEAGRAGAAWGLVIAWHREGGVAGFCDDLGVYETGVVMASTCKLEQTVTSERIFLNASQLEQLYTWLDELSTFEVEQSDPATADAMTIYMQFAGNGEKTASAELQQSILDFAAQVYTQATTGESTE
jgi:hypothetical protein